MNPLSPQPTPLDLRWRMFGISVRVHPTFWLFTWLFSYLYRPENVQNLSWQYTLLFMGLMFLAVLWHEMGHALMGRLFGFKGQIVLTGMGGMAIGEYDRARRWQRIAIALGGPAAGFLLWYLGDLFKFQMLPRIDPARNNLLLSRGVDFLCFEAFLWNTMNLIPVIPLDGGQVMRELVTGIFRKRGAILSLVLSIVFAGLIAGYSEPLCKWAAENWSNFWVLRRLNPFFTAIFFGIFALINLFSLVGEVFSKSKEPEPSEDEFADVKRTDDGDYPR